MTLDEMLALLPDNTTGAIGADDLRAIITGLYEFTASALAVGYKWDRDDTPGQQQVSITPGWATGGSTLLFSKVTASSANPAWEQLSQALRPGHHLRIRQNADLSVYLVAQITGTPTDAGGWWTITADVTEVAGAEPVNGTDMTLDIEYLP